MGAWVVEVTPPDDAGAEAQARFKFQTDLATCACLQMLAGEPILEVICEWHEDYIVTWSGHPRELTSVKHLEGDQPRWTLHGLLTDGGLARLYERWVETGQRCRVRLQTNSGLRRDSGRGPGALADACSTKDPEALDNWTDRLLPHLEVESQEDPEAKQRVRGFLAVLTLESELPRKEHARTVFIEKYAKPACAVMDLPSDIAGRLFDCVAELVARASRSNRKSVLAELLRAPDNYGDEVLNLIAGKLIDLQRVRDHVRDCLFPGKYSRPLSEVDESPTLALVQKLERGGFGPTMVARARHLRMTWVQQWRSLEHSLGNPNPLDRVAAKLFKLAERAELELDGYEEPYGRQLHERLSPLVVEISETSGSALFDEDLLWGGIFALTHDCKIWWSPAFNLESQT